MIRKTRWCFRRCIRDQIEFVVDGDSSRKDAWCFFSVSSGEVVGGARNQMRSGRTMPGNPAHYPGQYKTQQGLCDLELT